MLCVEEGRGGKDPEEASGGRKVGEERGAGEREGRRGVSIGRGEIRLKEHYFPARKIGPWSSQVTKDDCVARYFCCGGETQ